MGLRDRIADRDMNRVRTGCLTCRARRVKCDNSDIICNNCIRVGEPCIRPDKEISTPSIASIQSAIKRRRVPQSCTCCRSAKRKCTGEKPCQRCEKLGLECDFAEFEFPELTGESWAVGNLFRLATIRPLVNIFFADVYTLRSFGFIHKPTFLQRLEQLDQLDSEMQVLLMAICSLATKVDFNNDRAAWEQGNAWAKFAQQAVTSSFDRISVHSLTVVVLLHEHEARVGNYGNGFVLSGVAARLLQALQINLEFDFDIACIESKMTPTEKELRRRLMWACFLMDSFISSGTRQLQLIHQRDIEIQLPCLEDQFLFGKAVATELLEPGAVLGFIDRDIFPTPFQNLGLSAYLVRLISLRLQVLQYVKEYGNDTPPWSPASQFVAIENQLRTWKASLPEEFAYNANIIYIRKEQNLLSTLLFLHALYHQCFCDLYRIIMPALEFPSATNTNFQGTIPENFLSDLQRSCFQHACAMSEVFKESLSHKPEAFKEPCASILAHEATRVQVLYAIRSVGDSERDALIEQIVPIIQINVEFLSEMQQRFPTHSRLFSSMSKIIRKTGMPIDFNFTPTRSHSPSDTSDSNGLLPPPQTSPEYRMHPLSTFSFVRQGISEKHAPETSKWTTTPGRSSLTDEDDLFSSFITSDFEAWLMGEPL